MQGVLIHEHISPAYGVTLKPAQLDEPHVRAVEPMLERIVEHDPRAAVGRPPAPTSALSPCCRHFTLLHVAMLRTQGIPARARCGFGAYFVKGMFLDHWVTEYWNEAKSAGCWSIPSSTPASARCSGSTSIRSTCRATSS